MCSMLFITTHPWYFVYEQCISPSSSPDPVNDITVRRTFCTSVKWIEGNHKL